eukprot:jgi/Mesen1/3564/ME000199S02722
MLDASLSDPALSERSSLTEIVRACLKQPSPEELEACNASARSSGSSKGPAKSASSSRTPQLPKEPLSEAALERAADDLSNALAAIRSAGGEHTGSLEFSEKDAEGLHTTGWRQLKDDTGMYRVLYRPGPVGTLLHEICLEGVIDGPVDLALCVMLEVSLFREWWPQFSVPPFKMTESRYLKRLAPGNDATYVKMKVPWPLAPRDFAVMATALYHAPTGLAICTLRTLPESSEEWGPEWGGLTANDVPPSGAHLVRMEVRGGYAVRQISPTKCYLRVITMMDIKIEGVPPWVINFISRQLSGKGFLLMRKAILEAWKGGKGAGAIFRQLVQSEPFYVRVRAAMLESWRLHQALEAREGEGGATASGMQGDARTAGNQQLVAGNGGGGAASRKAKWGAEVEVQATGGGGAGDAGGGSGSHVAPLGPSPSPGSGRSWAGSALENGRDGHGGSNLSDTTSNKGGQGGDSRGSPRVGNGGGGRSDSQVSGGDGQVLANASSSGSSKNARKLLSPGNSGKSPMASPRGAEEYEGLAKRDPEAYKAVKTIDRLVAMFKTKRKPK